MPKYRKKPVVIDAIQLTEEIAEDCFFNHNPGPFGLFLSGSYNAQTKKVHTAYIYVDTLEGKLIARIGDWIIKGVSGELYPCKPDIFEQTYEPVE